MWDIILEAIKYFVLGIIQGITEVLPISSSGHVVIAKELINLKEDQGLLFLILINSGSFLVLLILYFKKLITIIKDFFAYIFDKSSRERTNYHFRFAWLLVIGSIPAGIIGIFFHNQLDNLEMVYSTLLAGVGLCLTGTVLILVSQKSMRHGKTNLSYKDAILIGLGQGIALIPGISRSGMTSSIAIGRGIGVDSALDFSFLLYIPASLGSIILLVMNTTKNGLGVTSDWAYLNYGLAFIGAAVATYFAYKLIFNIFKSGKLIYFGFYCLIMGLFSIILFAL